MTPTFIGHVFRRNQKTTGNLQNEHAQLTHPGRPTLVHRFGNPLTSLSEQKDGQSKGYSKSRSRSKGESNMLGDRFSDLPCELQILIICKLYQKDIFTLRLVCRAFNILIRNHASVIVRHLMKWSELEWLKAVYPLPKPPKPLGLDYLYGVSHRLHVVEEVAAQIAEFIMTKVYRRVTTEERKGFARQYSNMVRNVTPRLLVLFDFFETYRATLVHSADYRRAREYRSDIDRTHPKLEALESKIIEKKNYSIVNLHKTRVTYRLLLYVFQRKVRPPSYAGKFERSLRGWTRAPSTKEDCVKFIVLGGLEEIRNLLRLSHYRSRRKFLDDYLARLLPSDQQRRAIRQFIPASPLGMYSELDTGTSMGKVGVESMLRKTNARHGDSLICLSAMPRLDVDTAIQVSIHLPPLENLFTHAAERVAQAKLFPNRSVTPTTSRPFLEWLTEERANEFLDIHDPRGEIYDDFDGNDADGS